VKGLYYLSSGQLVYEKWLGLYGSGGESMGGWPRREGGGDAVLRGGPPGEKRDYLP